MKVLEDAGLVFFGNAWSPYYHADCEAAICGRGAHADLSSTGELDLVTDWVEKYQG